MLFNLRKRHSTTQVTNLAPIYTDNIQEKIEIEPQTYVDPFDESKNEAEPIIEFLFPSAEEMVQKSSEKWKKPSKEQILEKILNRAETGYRYATFYESLLAKELKAELEDQGYRVKEDEILKVP